MRIKGIRDEDFVNYKKPAMFIISSLCDWKCCIEQNIDISICQNSDLANAKIIDLPTIEIYRRYLSNPITSSIVIGGLEPFLQFDEILDLLHTFRNSNCSDDFIIYTGYYPSEVSAELDILNKYTNIIVKFGRYIPGHLKHFDDVLGVNLASDNQYAKRVGIWSDM